jgi:predicted RNase H-like HicB family nuclease
MKYEVIIYWSEADESFVAEVPELRTGGMCRRW